MVKAGASPWGPPSESVNRVHNTRPIPNKAIIKDIYILLGLRAITWEQDLCEGLSKII